MKLKGLVLGKVSEIVRNKNILKAMARRKHIIFPIDKTNNPYVDHDNTKPRTFIYKKQEYLIEYMSGCFYPFVIKKRGQI